MRCDEIKHYTEKLKEYDTEISQLPDLSPTDLGTRKNAMKVARIITQNHHLREFFLKTKTLPMHELVKLQLVCEEVIHNYPQYITAMTLLFMMDYQHLRTCLRLDE